MQDRLSKLVAIFDGLDFRANRAEGDDLLGDAYEYLMRHFATESRQEQGPVLHARPRSRASWRRSSASTGRGKLREPDRLRPHLRLRLAAASRRPTRRGTPKLAIYGQEMDDATWALARMNMILHGHPTAELWRGNTLAEPALQEQGRQPQDLRLRRRQSALLGQGLVERPRPGARRVRPLRARHPAGQERRLRLPAAPDRVAQEHRQGRDHPAPRRAVPRQQGGRHPPEPHPARPDQGHHRPARQPLLRHRHPGLHRGHRQGARRTPAPASS